MENAEMACGLPSSRISKSSCCEVANELAVAVGDHGVHLDVLDVDPEGRRLWCGRRGRAGRRCVLAGPRCAVAGRT